jgi:hypothetical protein
LGEPPRRFCLKIDPRFEIDLVRRLGKAGTVTPDRSGRVLWAELTLEEADLEGVPGVIKAIEYQQPLWADVLQGPG